MNWKLVHSNVEVLADSGIVSRSQINFSHNNTQITIADTNTVENHILGSKKVLLDTAYKLEEMARQMKNKADKLH